MTLSDARGSGGRSPRGEVILRLGTPCVSRFVELVAGTPRGSPRLGEMDEGDPRGREVDSRTTRVQRHGDPAPPARCHFGVAERPDREHLERAGLRRQCPRGGHHQRRSPLPGAADVTMVSVAERRRRTPRRGTPPAVVGHLRLSWDTSEHRTGNAAGLPHGSETSVHAEFCTVHRAALRSPPGAAFGGDGVVGARPHEGRHGGRRGLPVGSALPNPGPGVATTTDRTDDLGCRIVEHRSGTRTVAGRTGLHPSRSDARHRGSTADFVERSPIRRGGIRCVHGRRHPRTQRAGPRCTGPRRRWVRADA